MKRIKPMGPGRGSRLRLALLLATAAAFLLIPAAQALATPTLEVSIEGTGNGEVSSVGGAEFAGEGEGSPPIECTYAAPGPAEGACENVMDFNTGAGFYEENLHAVAAPGSSFVGYTISGADIDVFNLCENWEEEASYEEWVELNGGPPCWLRVEGSHPSAHVEVTATFESEGPIGPILTVVKEGSGEGTVVSSPAGIECFSGTCETEFAENTEVTLTASPAAGSAFSSWKKCDTGKVEGRKCTVKMSEAKTVGAKFSATYDVTVKKTTGATGVGSVTGISCDASCTSITGAVLVGKTVTLTPKPPKTGSVFTEWSSCPGEIVETNKCKMSAAGTAEAKFTAIEQLKLTVNKSGGGQGTVKTKPTTINCGLTCSTQTSLFFKGTSVELTAAVTAGKGSTFTGFTGGTGSASGCSTSPCIFAIEANSSVTAKFE